MRRYFVLLPQVWLLLSISGRAETWRSASGSIFSFQPNGTMTVRHQDGKQTRGRWWWVTQSRVIGYRLDGEKDAVVVTLHKRGAIVQRPGEKKRHWFIAPTR